MKTLIVLILLTSGLLAQATEVRGKVVSVVADDGGQKIIISQGMQVSATYLQNSHPSYEPISDLVGLAKESNKKLLIKVDDEYLRYVKSVSLEK